MRSMSSGRRKRAMLGAALERERMNSEYRARLSKGRRSLALADSTVVLGLLALLTAILFLCLFPRSGAPSQIADADQSCRDIGLLLSPATAWVAELAEAGDELYVEGYESPVATVVNSASICLPGGESGVLVTIRQVLPSGGRDPLARGGGTPRVGWPIVLLNQRYALDGQIYEEVPRGK